MYDPFLKGSEDGSAGCYVAFSESGCFKVLAPWLGPVCTELKLRHLGRFALRSLDL
jgi:hypothetical protein